MARTNDVDLEVIDEFVLKATPDRTVKAQAPKALQPNNRFGSPIASLHRICVIGG